jgi:transcriptional regulator with XRE-family HTH domain
MILVRQLLGGVLRRQRMRQGRTLRQISADARVSLGYISEVERGQKEASSELLAAICAALDVPLSTVLQEVSEELARLEEQTLREATSDLVPAGLPDEPSELDLVPAAGEAPTALAKRLDTHPLDTHPLETHSLETQHISGERIVAPGNERDVVVAA